MTDAMALDRASVRSYDADGRLRVEITPISKANICPYYGREIRDWEKLGLDPDKVYRLYRDPEELEKAAPTFNNLPLLSRHVPVTADGDTTHRPDLVVGSLGTDAVFDAPYLKNSLIIWARPSINAVEAERQKELSSAYRYRADMKPGTVDGEAYDGVMRDIVGNHVALVEEGRAGPDVVVGDSKEQFTMTKTVLSRKAILLQGAAMAFLAPKLAQDAKVDLTPAFKGVDAKNFKDKTPGIIAEITKRVEGKLAQDADIEGLPQALEAVAPADPAEAVDEEPGNDVAELKAQVAALAAQVAKIVKAEGAEAAAMDEESDDEKDDDKDKVTKPAMDKAIADAVKSATEAATKRQVQIRDAERAVRPYVGDLAVAFDSAEAVYETALKTLGVVTEGVHPSAFAAILSTIPVPGSTPKKAVVAQDAAAAKGFAERYPDAKRITLI